MHNIDPDLLRSFLAIQESGSYAAAAGRVNKTQSTISAQMSRLEEILDTSLFEKEGRRNVLTPSGARFLDYARSILRLHDEALTAFRPPSLRGQIRIGTSDDYAQAFLPPVLGSFSRAFPDIEVTIVTGNSADLLGRMEAEGFDAVIASIGEGVGNFVRLRNDRLHWLGAEKGSAHLAERLPLALWPDGCAWRSIALAALARRSRDWRIVHTTSNAPLLAASVAEDLGVTVGPRWYLVPGLRVITTLDRDYPLGSVDIGVKLPSKPSSALLDAFVAFLKQSLAATAPQRIGHQRFAAA